MSATGRWKSGSDKKERRDENGRSDRPGRVLRVRETSGGIELDCAFSAEKARKEAEVLGAREIAVDLAPSRFGSGSRHVFLCGENGNGFSTIFSMEPKVGRENLDLTEVLAAFYALGYSHSSSTG